MFLFHFSYFLKRLLLLVRLLGSAVATDYESVITFVGFKSELFLGLDAFFLEFLDFTGKDCSSINGRIDTIGLDGNDNVTTGLQEVVSIQGDNTGLIGLSNVSENDIDHSNEHAIFVGVTSVFNDGDDVRSLLGHVDQVTTGTVREFDRVNTAARTDNISNVGN